MDGWGSKVFQNPRCQQEKRLTRMPGAKNNVVAMIAPTLLSVPTGSQEPSTARAKAKALLARVKPQAKKMRTNCGEKRPPRKFFFSARIVTGPTFKLIARPMVEEKTDVA